MPPGTDTPRRRSGRLPSIRRRVALVTLPLLVVGITACGTISTTVCGLSSYALELQADLEALGALDPELVAQEGTPENAAALAAIDDLDATRTAAQEALDAASEDDVGRVVRSAFQAALDATELATEALREAIASGDSATVGEALDQVQRATDAINAFLGVVDGLEADCPEPSAADSGTASPSEAITPTPEVTPTEAPTPTVEPTPEPTPTPEATLTATPEPTSSPTTTPSPSPSPTAPPTASPTPTPSPSPSPTASPTPTPTATASPSPTPSQSASTTASESPQPSSSPGDEPGDDGGGLPGWAVIGALGLGAAALFVWARSRSSSQPPDATDGTGETAPPGATEGPGEMEPPEDLPPGGPPPAEPPTPSG
jgi:outer membrane biosynthesis protein TonB